MTLIDPLSPFNIYFEQLEQLAPLVPLEPPYPLLFCLIFLIRFTWYAFSILSLEDLWNVITKLVLSLLPFQNMIETAINLTQIFLANITSLATTNQSIICSWNLCGKITKNCAGRSCRISAACKSCRTSADHADQTV